MHIGESLFGHCFLICHNTSEYAHKNHGAYVVPFGHRGPPASQPAREPGSQLAHVPPKVKAHPQLKHPAPALSFWPEKADFPVRANER